MLPSDNPGASGWGGHCGGERGVCGCLGELGSSWHGAALPSGPSSFGAEAWAETSPYMPWAVMPGASHWPQIRSLRSDSRGEENSPHAPLTLGAP